MVIGLTGGIGSGKSYVCDLFAKLGVDIIDADIIARDVVKPKTPALAQIKHQFGNKVINEDGTLDRAALRELVFSDPINKDWLNQLLHPIIREQMIEQSRAATSIYSILCIPLLTENKLTDLVDKVLVVDCDPQVQLKRTMQRDNNSEQLVRNIMQSQASRAQRLAIADFLIDNSDDSADLSIKVLSLHKEFRKLALEFAD